jgi:hypothetical protein
MENPERVTFYFYDGPEGYESRPDESCRLEIPDEYCSLESCRLESCRLGDKYDIKIGDQVKIYIKPYNLISNYTAIVKEIVANIAFIEITTIRKRELVRISLKDHLIKKI